MDPYKFRYIPLEEREEISKKLESQKILTDTEPAPKTNFVKNFLTLIVVVFAFVGVGFLTVYFCVNLHLTNTDGIVDKQSDTFWENGKSNLSLAIKSIPDNQDKFFNQNNYCYMKALKEKYPGTFWRIFTLANNDKKDLAQNNLNVAVDSLNKENSVDIDCQEINKGDITKKDFDLLANVVDNKDLFIFATSTEWSFFKTAVLKDKDVIKKVEGQTGIKSRILVAELVAEQMRLFYSNRAWFETMISPVKILASMSQFSWGVLGIKEETAVQIEKNLKDKSSAFYLGSEYENMLDFSTTTNINQDRFKRITKRNDNYYAYLYAGLFNKEIITQWQNKGIDISARPEILATIYNIGFIHSKPNNNPQTGGAELDIGGGKYSFGRIAYDFYYSGEMLDDFPQ